MLWLQFGLASKPAKASFLTPPEQDWLVERQAAELAARRKEDAFAGSMWGVFLCTLHTFECCTSDISFACKDMAAMLASHWAACMGGMHQVPCACCQADLADLAATLSLAPLSQLHHDLVYILKYLSFASFLVRMVFPKGIFQLCTCQLACYGSCNATSQVMLSPVGTVLQAST